MGVKSWLNGWYRTSLASVKASERILEPSDFPFLSWSSVSFATEEVSVTRRSLFDIESVRLERKAILVHWSWFKFSYCSKEILDENMLEILTSMVRSSTMLLRVDLPLPRVLRTRFQKSLLLKLHHASANFSLLMCSACILRHRTSYL